jgi:hypothetical protein
VSPVNFSLIILEEGGLVVGDKDKALALIVMAHGGQNGSGIIGKTSNNRKGERKWVFSAVKMEA